MELQGELFEIVDELVGKELQRLEKLIAETMRDKYGGEPPPIGLLNADYMAACEAKMPAEAHRYKLLSEYYESMT